MIRTPRRVGPYTDLGRVRIPPLPIGIAFTDRSTGEILFLSHNSTTHTISLVPPPAAWKGTPWPVDDGPVMLTPAGMIRLFVEDGELDYETAPPILAGRQDPRILTRNYSENSIVYEVVTGEGWTFGDPLTLVRVLG